MTADEPAHLVEDAETEDRFLIHDGEKGLRLDIRYEGETLWMTQEQIARLFGRERIVITQHTAKIWRRENWTRRVLCKKCTQPWDAQPTSTAST